jgi:hypothetical protein
MDPSEFTLRLLLLFLPGIITRLIIERLTVPHDRSQLYFFLHAFVSGVLAYAVYGCLLTSWNCLSRSKQPSEVRFVASLLDSSESINFTEVAIVCGIAIANGFALSALINHKYLNRMAQRLRVTRKFGDLDVWSYLHNSTTDSLRWVRVRDHRHNLCYEGWVEAFSDTFASNELFLREVKVFRNDTGEFLYDVGGVYLSQDPTSLALEFHALAMRESVVEAAGGGAKNVR